MRRNFSADMCSEVVPQDSVEGALGCVLEWRYPKLEQFFNGPRVVSEARDHPWSAF